MSSQICCCHLPKVPSRFDLHSITIYRYSARTAPFHVQSHLVDATMISLISLISLITLLITMISLITLLKNVVLRFSFIGIPETWLWDSSLHTDISGYNFVHNPRKDRRGGGCLLYTSPSPRDLSTSRMPSSA